jgi:D-alanyl-D-alanine carboxypeptidase
VIRRSEIEARNERAKLVEAEHLLLALAAHSESDAGRLLIACGLDHRRLAAALRDEHRRSLAFAGIKISSDDEVDATERRGSLALGTSAKAAIKRAMIVSRTDRPRRATVVGTDLVVGILQAELGTVPRALAIAGIDPAVVIARTRRSE